MIVALDEGKPPLIGGCSSETDNQTQHCTQHGQQLVCNTERDLVGQRVDSGNHYGAMSAELERERGFLPVAMAVKKRTSGQMSLMTVAWSFFHEREPLKRGFWATMTLALWRWKREKYVSKRVVWAGFYACFENRCHVGLSSAGPRLRRWLHRANDGIPTRIKGLQNLGQVAHAEATLPCHDRIPSRAPDQRMYRSRI